MHARTTIVVDDPSIPIANMVSQLKPSGIRVISGGPWPEGDQPVAFAVNAANGHVLAIDRPGTSTGTNLGRLVGDRLEHVRRSALVIDFSCEGLSRLWTRMFDGLHRQMADLAIPMNRVILAQQSHAVQDNYHEWRAAVGITGPQPQFIWMHSFLVGVLLSKARWIKRWWRDGQALEERFAKGHPEHRFLCLNHRTRRHRLRFAMYAVHHGLLDRGLVSFLDPEFGKDDLLRQENERYPDHAYSQPDLNRIVSDLRHLVPLTVEAERPPDIARDPGMDLMDRTGFSVVPETEMTAGQLMRFTEKSIKPLIGGHPSLVLGNPGTLAELQGLGFKTFDGFIDESYDAIRNPCKRFYAVMNEFQRLCHLSDDDFVRWREDMAPILFHNTDHALNVLPNWIGSRMFGDLRVAIWQALRSG